MVLKTNLGSIAKVKSKLLHTQASLTFQRIYIYFQGSIVGFVNSCRPFISIDKCYLKGPFRDVLLNVIA